MKPSTPKQRGYMTSLAKRLANATRVDVDTVLFGLEVEDADALTSAEANENIQLLKEKIYEINPNLLTENERTSTACDVKRKKMLAIGMDMGWHKGGKGDYIRVNNWVKKNSRLKKDMNLFTSEELDELITQFQQVFNETITRRK